MIARSDRRWGQSPFLRAALGTVPFLLFALLAPTHAQRIGLGCSVDAHAGTTQECQGFGFPFRVPADRWFCVTDHVLMAKFPYDPPEYGTRMRSLYFQLPGLTVPAHHPQISLNTPIAYPPGTLYTGSISNQMSERQNVFAIVTGFLALDQECLERAPAPPPPAFNLTGRWVSEWPGGTEVETVTQIGSTLTVVSPSSGRVGGTIQGSEVSLYVYEHHLRGKISADGKEVQWSNGVKWTR